MLKKINQTLNIALFPFKDLSFFHEDLICKIYEAEDDKERQKYTEILYKKVRNNILYQYPVRNVDEINLMINKYYLLSIYKKKEKFNAYQRYLEILKEFATCLISHRDGSISYKYWKNKKDDEFLGPYDKLKKVQVFQNLSKIISMDLLSNVYLVMNNIENVEQLNNFYADINLADMQLDDVLVNGVAENHIHANASFNFNLNWQLMMNEKINNIYQLLEFNGYVNEDFKKTPTAYIDLAVILRILLAQYLKAQKYKKELNFKKWIYKLDKILEGVITRIQEEKELSKYDHIYFKDVLDQVKKIFDINDGDRQHDIIFSIFPEYKKIKTYGENIFLFKSLIYLNKCCNVENKSSYTLFMDLFLQYIRIKNEVYKQMIQSDNIKGLTYFQEYFTRSTFVVKNSISNKEEYYLFMLRTLFQNEYLKKVELRFGIPEKEDELRKNIAAMLRAYKRILEEDYRVYKNPNIDFPKMGLVYHLIKEKEYKENEKCWYGYNEQLESTYNEISFKKLQTKYRNQISNLVNLRNNIPYLSHFILGIDAASLENNTPVQIFAPIYEEARDSKKDPFIIIDKEGMPIKNKSLAFTFHAGEDFRHLISGLRRIDEVIEHCKFHSGDRIGHATALGIDIDYWSKKNPVIIIPRGEYLDNLIWVWGIYTKTQNNNPKVSMYLEQEIYTLAKVIFKNTNGMNTPMIYDAYKERFKEFEVDKKYMSIEKDNSDIKEELFCIKSPENYRIIWNSEKIIYAYHCKCYLEKINEPIYVSVKDLDIDIMKEVQKGLVEKVSKEGIVIEVNPSSNAAIGEIENIFKNHAFEINHIDDKGFSNVMININSDDPIVFNTNISNEYAYIYYGLLDKGVSKEAALEWIDKVRKCGMETSFINNKLSNAQYYEYLTKALEEL